MNSDKIFGKLMVLNLKIFKNYFSKTVFEDKIIELSFQEYKFRESKMNRISCDLFLILGYISFYIFLLSAFYRVLFLITCSIFFLIAIILIILSHFIRNRNIINFIDLIQIFLSSINLILKGLMVSLYYSTSINDNHEEITRIIIYEFISTNLLISFIMESDIRIYFYFFLQNLGLIIVAINRSIKDRFYQYDAFISFFMAFIFFMIRKEWDYSLRLIFSEKYKFQVYFNYASNYFNGLNCFTLNIQNNKNIYYKNNFAYFINKNEFVSSQNFEEENSDENQLLNFLNNDDNFDIFKKKFNVENIDENSPFFIKKENFFKFANNLKFYKRNSIKTLTNKKIIVDGDFTDQVIENVNEDDENIESPNSLEEKAIIGIFQNF